MLKSISAIPVLAFLASAMSFILSWGDIVPVSAQIQSGCQEDSKCQPNCWPVPHYYCEAEGTSPGKYCEWADYYPSDFVCQTVAGCSA